MRTMLIGTYTEPRALGLEEREIGIQLYLHRLDANTYLLGDDVNGLCFEDIKIPAKIGHKVMQGDFEALAEAGPEVAAFIQRPHFKFADSRIITDTDPSLLNSDHWKHNQAADVRT